MQFYQLACVQLPIDWRETCDRHSGVDKLSKKRRSVWFSSWLCVVAGSCYLVFILALYFHFRSKLDLIASHDQRQATVFQLVGALKAGAFLVSGALSFTLIVTSWTTLSYLRMSRPAVTPKASDVIKRQSSRATAGNT